jgi:hypothetical protein
MTEACEQYAGQRKGEKEIQENATAGRLVTYTQVQRRERGRKRRTQILLVL